MTVGLNCTETGIGAFENIFGMSGVQQQLDRELSGRWLNVRSY